MLASQVFGRPLQVVLVEDNPADVTWCRIVLREMGLDFDLLVLEDGEDALAYLRAPNRSVLDIILLDINLPRLTGPEVLANLGGAGDLPVCILTTSSVDRDRIVRTFNLDGRCFLEKPLLPEHFLNSLFCFDHLKPLAEKLKNQPWH